MEAAMDDRRRLLRKYLLIYSRVFERTVGKLLGYLADLSQEGAMIIAEDPLTVGAVLTLRFDLPDPKIFHMHNLNISARVARCNPDLSPEFYDIGLEFLDVTPEQKIVIEKMMELYEFQRENSGR
jgi:c-di-GMP-binding flagellar brake protein YcgR